MKREVRASLVAGQGGVGAVIDVGSESFLIPGIGTWKQSQLRVIDLPRLSTRLRKVLKAPKEDSPTLLVRRFPRSMFCEKCRRMVLWQTHMEVTGKEPTCQAGGCGGALVPMRFVMACENGHLDDVPWDRWAHSGTKGNPNCRKQIDELSFVVSAESSTGGLGSLEVHCQCGSSRSLEDIANKAIVKAFFRSCSGNHPWVRGPRTQCDAEPVVLQRGATNLHYPSTLSALDIPSASEADPTEAYGEQIRSHARYGRLLSVVRSTEGDNGEFIELLSETIAAAIGCDAKTVVAVAIGDADGQQAVSTSNASAAQLDQAVLLEEEWATLGEALHSGGVQSNMFSATSEGLDASAPQWIRRITDGV